jgi:hypothetical protein
MPTGIYARQKGRHGRPKGIKSKFKGTGRKAKKIQQREIGITLRDTVSATPLRFFDQINSIKLHDEHLDIMERY